MEKFERVICEPISPTLAPRWTFELLGGFRARCDDLTLDKFQTQKTATLLAYLAYFPGKQHSRDHLADMLWPDADIDVARKRLSQALTWLRSKLEFRPEWEGKILFADRQSVWLDSVTLTVDVHEFLRLCGRSRIGGAEGNEARITAVGLYRGALLPEMFEEWVFSEREHLQTSYFEALKELMEECEQRQDWSQAVTYARRGIEADPLSEMWHCNLMRMLAASGQAEAAIRQFGRLERVFAEQLDERPSQSALSLRDDIERSRQIQLSDIASVPKPAAIIKPVSRFFGRDAEMQALRDMVLSQEIRLVTVSGVAGSGKSRLVLELCASISEEFGGRVWFVPIADVRDPLSVPALLRDLFRISPSGSMQAKEQVVRALSTAPSLLVLDNVEHLSEGIAPFIKELLESTPPLKILTTSQKLLAISGESEFSLGPLAVPAWDPTRGYSDDMGAVTNCASVKLFEDRARCVRPSFTITSQNVGAITQLCSKLEGLPLAIELCASWAQALTPAQMLSQLMSRFEFLFSRRSDIPVRHRSLHAALEYGFLLLSPEVRDFFVQLSVFRGGWTLEAANAVCLSQPASPGVGGTLKALTLLTELRERSLVLAEEDAIADPASAMRFRMLDALREFAALQRTLASDRPLRQRHAEYFLSVLESRNSGGAEIEESVFMNLVESDNENFRCAMAWCLETASESDFIPREVGLRMAIALTPFWEIKGLFAEGCHWFEELLLLRSASPELLVRGLHCLGRLARSQADFLTAHEAADEAMELSKSLDDGVLMMQSLNLKATISQYQGDNDLARTLLYESREIGRQLPCSEVMASLLVTLGLVAMNQQNWPEAEQHCFEALFQLKSLQAQDLTARTMNNLGLVYRYQNKLEMAEETFRECLALEGAVSDILRTVSQLNLGTVYRLQRKLTFAWEALEATMSHLERSKNLRVCAWCIKELGHFACALENWSLGVRLLASSEALKDSLGISFSPADPGELARDSGLAKTACGTDRFQADWAEGLRWTTDESFARARRELNPVVDSKSHLPSEADVLIR